MFPIYAPLAVEITRPFWDPLGLGKAAAEYWRDACERSVLYLDVMRQRGNQYLEHMEETKPNVLGFDTEVLLDGRTLPNPVNYELMRILPTEGIEIDESMRPFVVVDPRAGHGPGIGGFKPDSEIGVALRAGHPCYFIGFLPYPVPGQTVEDVVEAEVQFLRHVIERHPDVAEQPMVVGNCQAGWQIMMAAALEPDCFGPILIAGAPLSYWAGERGKNPMRYSAGMLGGSWLTTLVSDLGHGQFDGAWLVQNFEKLNPANTFWSKQYNLYANVDSEAQRYLRFERWWGGHVVLNSDEIQYIVDNLFIGNRLSTSQLLTRDGRRIDLRNIRSPIVVFCSQGDDITPPPQALGWIDDLYESVDDIQAHDQTIVYCVHDTTGHLGIFVSGSVSRKEHAEFTANMDYIDILPPGLYESKVTERDASQANPDLIDGDYLLEFAPRDFEDIDAIVKTDIEDERRFATVSRISNINLGLYRRYLQPLIQAVMTPEAASWMRRSHPLKMGYKLLSDRNPATVPLPVMADAIKASRHPVDDSNPFKVLEGMISDQIVQGLNAYRDLRDQATEQLFMQVYGQPLLQTLMGLRADDQRPLPLPGASPEHHRFVEQRKQALLDSIDEGTIVQASVRALIFVLGGSTTTDERNFQRLKATRDEMGADVDLTTFKTWVRDEFEILNLDGHAAIQALPTMLQGEDAATIDAYMAHIEQVVRASEPLEEKTQTRLAIVKKLFERAKPVQEAPAQPEASSGESTRRSNAGRKRRATRKKGAPGPTRDSSSS
ncbi:Protein of unknown function [Modicisalibacter ilicicola DSM 19980]|uniref:Poly(3-hydroxyalkanoate) synthetase n=1 Tax=Modicisalibacter ilicicola DSM 19980 TaxID=1121942 RepID=A0A1M5BTH1_9GAMM|nr:DUF3141 domain-containing protein [Halomonas ilicicola]SHF45853.1 Protein of unknown function [Halomonas ilicicola DSM 19980]